MSHLYATYCSADKRDDEKPLPAIQRYRSERIASVANRAQTDDVRFGILSGSFGLIAPGNPLPWYDHLMTAAEVAAMSKRVSLTLKQWNITAVRWFSASASVDPDVEPYAAAMRAACRLEQIPFTRVDVETP